MSISACENCDSVSLNFKIKSLLLTVIFSYKYGYVFLSNM